MRYLLVVVCLLLKLNSNGQEKRLAWVIGNSNYEKGFLKNPVNDALLVAKTLKELNFTVLLDTNIATEKDFNDAVRKFGEQRSNFNIGFIYYAGHGIQIKDVNYLLPTKEDYLDEYDIEDKALSVQKIMRYIEDRSSEVNVLILDACRDNPFEKTWKATGRSLEGGRGLAKANPPTGSLIAYSTDAGNIAADGTGKNSIYCLSLIKNMQIENLTLDQVFRNVRSEVLKLSENKQRPVEASQLTGEAFYLKRGTYLEQINVIDSLIKKENYTLALQEVSSILTHDATNKMALCRKGEILFNLQGEKYDGADLFKAIKLFPNDPEPLVYLGRYYYSVDKKDEALREYGKAIKLDSTYAKAYLQRTTIYEESKQLDKALMDYNKTIELEPKNDEYYFYRAVFYQKYKEDYQNTLIDFSKAIELNPKEVVFWYERGNLYYIGLNNNKKALEDYNKLLELDSTDIDAINSIGLIYQNQGELEKAIETYNKGISLEKTNPTSASYCYRNRASIYEKQNLLDTALEDYNKAIELDPTNAYSYSYRANFYQNYKQDYQNALIDFSKAIELSPNDKENWYSRGILFDDYLNNNTKALEDYNKVLELDSTDGNTINAIGVIYQDEKQLDKAIETYNRGIQLKKVNPSAAAFCYRNRASVYEKQNLLDKALEDYNNAILLDSSNGVRYWDRANYYQDYKEDYQNALIDFSKAIELNPTKVSYWYARGGLFFLNIKNNRKALEDFNKMLEIDSTDADAINAIGLIYQNEGELEKAIETYIKGIGLEKINPSSASYCYRNRASVYEKQNLLEKALADYNKAIELDLSNADRFLDRANFYQDYKEDYQNALIDFSKAIELNPTKVSYWYARGGLFFLNIKNNKKALEDFNKMLEIDSTAASAINAIGLIYQNEGELEKAIETFNRGINLEKNNPSSAAYCYRNRASIYEKQNLLDKALDDYNKAIELDPTNADRYSDRADFYKDYKEDYQNALNDFSKAIELNPQDLKNWYARGQLYRYNLNNNKKALEDYNKMLELDSNNIEAINAIGVIYQNEGQLEKAIETFNRGINLEKNNPSSAAYCYRNRASIYEKQNLLDKALDDYNKAIELDPTNADRYSDRADFYKDNKKEYYDALVDYTMAISLDSSNIDSWWKRGLLFSNKFNDQTSAIKDFKYILRIDSNKMGALNWLGVFNKRVGNEIEAKNIFINVISRVNNNFKDKEDAYIGGISWSYNNLAESYRQNYNNDSAVFCFEQAIKYDSLNPERFYRAGYNLGVYLNDYNKAVTYLNYSIKLDDKNPQWYYYLSQINLYNKIEKEAIKNIDKAIKLADKPSFYIAERGNIYRTFKKFNESENDLKSALEMDSSMVIANHYKILLFKERNQVDLAIDFCEKRIITTKTDTATFYLLGELYLITKEYLKALNCFNNAISCFNTLSKKEFNYGFQTENPNLKLVYLSNAYQKVGEVYQLLGDKELPKEYYAKALIALKDEIRPDKLLKEKELQDLLQQ